MNKEYCYKIDTCPQYNNLKLTKTYKDSLYLKKYCKSPTNQWKSCARLEIEKIFGKCPDKLLPDDNIQSNDILFLPICKMLY